MKLIPHIFNSYELESNEEIESQLFNVLQVAGFHNLLAKYSQDKLLLVFDPKNPLEYAQQEAYLRGQIDLLRYLLDCNDLAQTTLKGEIK